MNYQETLNWMYAQLPMYQREGAAAYKANLDNTLALDQHFNHPHTRFKTIHVAGTNGKGSTSHMLASILQEAGCKTGLYTSPHLKDFRERIKVNGEMIPEAYVCDFVEENKAILQEIKPSFFEMTVALAFNYFAEMGMEIAVIETGLGGRLDSTNIIRPLVSVITNISFDHCALLGHRLEEIAGEKAGIIKAGIPVVIGAHDSACDPVFETKAGELQAPLTYATDEWRISRMDDNIYRLKNRSGHLIDHLTCGLKGFYQIKNIPTVVETAFILQRSGLPVSQQAIAHGIARVVENTGLYGRWQQLSAAPLTICDTGHNEDGIKEILKQINNCTYRQLHIVLGMVNDKEIDAILKLLPKGALYYFCKASIPRAMDEQLLAAKAHKYGLNGAAHPTVAAAYMTAKKNARPDDMIYIGGSTFVVAEVI